MLEKAGVSFHETPTHLFSFGAIWVADEDFERAGAILGGLTLASVRNFPKPAHLLFGLAGAMVGIALALSV